MKRLPSLLCALAALLISGGAHAGGISDVGVNAYWGANGRGAGDVIGGSTYDVNGATITRLGSVLTFTIATSFAGHAGTLANVAPGGIGYGDLFLAQSWNPYGTDSHHGSDNAANGTHWSLGFSLDNRWSNTGGSFKVYALSGTTNAKNIRSSAYFMDCKVGKNCDYRDGQAAAVNTASATVHDTGLIGTWTVAANQELRFSIDAASSDLLNASSYALHWGETCQNDVIEGLASVDPAQQAVPAPGSLPLLALGLGAMLVLRRRATRAASGAVA